MVVTRTFSFGVAAPLSARRLKAYIGRWRRFVNALRIVVLSACLKMSA